MIVVSPIEAKLFAIIVLAFMNFLLLKRKPNKQTIESYTIEDSNTNFNIVNDNHDQKDQSDNNNLPKTNQQKNTINHNSLLIENTNHQDLSFFVNIKNKPNNQVQQQQTRIQQKNSQENSIIHPNLQKQILPIYESQNLQQQELKLPLKQIEQKSENQQEQFQSIPMDLEIPSKDQKDQAKSQNQENPKQFNHRKLRLLSVTQRKNHFQEAQFPSQVDSQSDSQTKKLKHTKKPIKQGRQDCDCQICHIKTRKQTLKRCIQNLFCDAVSQMVEKSSEQLGLTTKKKKRMF